MASTPVKPKSTARRLEPHERETIVRFDQEGDEASVFTYARRWQTHLEKRLEVEPSLVNSRGGKEYLIPKEWVRMPLRRRRRSK